MKIHVITFGVLLIAALSAKAEVMKYEFHTTGNVYGNPFIVKYLKSINSSPSVSGSFFYNSGAPLSIPSTNYGYGDFYPYGQRVADPALQSISNLSGNVTSSSLGFIDPIGIISISNDSPNYPGYPPPTDRVGINFEPIPVYGSSYILSTDLPKQDLQGFSIVTAPFVPAPIGPTIIDGIGYSGESFATDGRYTLANVRLFWFSGVYPAGVGSLDFLSNNDSPEILPEIRGRLAFDFYATSDASKKYSFNSSVFFDGLFVRRAEVPVPATLALLSLGLIGLGAARRSRPDTEQTRVNR